MSDRQILSAADSRPRRSGGFTLVEVLVVISIIGILVALLLPAIMSVRELARRAQCHNNLVQLVLAVNQYEMTHSVYPPGTIESQGPIQNVAKGYHHSWITQILPYIEQRNTYLHIDYSVGVYAPQNATVRDLGIGLLNCPSSGFASQGYSEYAGVHHDIEAPIDVNNNGIFFLNSHVRRDEVLDGTSQTFFLGEKVTLAGDLGWMSGTNATLRNTGSPGTTLGQLGTGIRRPSGPPSQAANTPSDSFGMDIGMSMPAGMAGGDAEVPAPSATGAPPDPSDQPMPPATEAAPTIEATAAPPADVDPEAVQAAAEQAAEQAAALLFVGGFGSVHPGVINFAFGDGSVRCISMTIDGAVYQQLGHRADGKLLDMERY